MTNCLQYYSFRVSIRGVERLTADLEDSLHRAGCSDALLSVTKGVVSLNFTRLESSMSKAISKAEKQIESVQLQDGGVLSIRGLHIVSEL